MEYVSNKKNQKDFQNYINSFGHFDPRKGKNMNDFTETPVGEAIVDVRHFIIDADGNRIEVPFDASNGETAPEETTVFVAEDYADTRVEPVTIH